MGIFSSIKSIGTMIIGFLALFGFWKYKNKDEKINELKSYVEQKDKEVKAMKETVVVQDKVYQQKEANLVMEKQVSEDSSKIDEKIEKSKKELHYTVDNAVEGEEFDLKA